MSTLINSLMIEKDVDLQCSKKHKLPIQMVVLDSKLTSNERLLCSDCLENFESNAKMVGLTKVLQIIDDKYIKLIQHNQNLISSTIEQIEMIQSSLFEIKSNFNQTLDQLIGNSEEWIKFLYQQGQKTYMYSFFEELELLIQNQQTEDLNQQILKQIQHINLSWITKITHKIQQFNYNSKDLIKNLRQQILSLVINYKTKEINQNKQEGNIDLKLINNTSYQSDDCFAISFNNSGSLMISGCGKFIKLWEFQNGNINEVLKLKGHNDTIRCLTFTNSNNSFISGSGDCSIRCWKQLNFKSWKSSESYNDHTDYIECILLSKDDTQLISSSQDKSIKIWNFDISKNELKLQQTLNQSKYCLNSISLNFSETILVSCGDNNEIIIWGKNKLNYWEYQNTITQSYNEYGTKVCFLKDYQFIWVSGDIQSGNQARIFEFQGGKFIENTSKTIELENDNEFYDLNLFPIVYNKEQNIILIRHKFNIYLLREQNNGLYKIVQKVKQHSNSIQGSMTKDANYLTFWDSYQKIYTTYEIESK
ncbi:unnamed protein product (macronuclear) [Paramecium tetraurelia]|uniref:Uncharacterized protein n=1 Tax=Paramecium tetraurelia TaxID=5888 RepID=A0C7Z4_PARTE|nr:uncharacterized protein GSPATT00036042001 [Paramecium tetraurelia]CAK66911.1 unnamed protein product [Paramecium tetraurelia]|eukprot:XP_001434308.1 hypothetical protein (macronuclear) [Paramecium tetraurelia strain d4-2]